MLIVSVWMPSSAAPRIRRPGSGRMTTSGPHRIVRLHWNFQRSLKTLTRGLAASSHLLSHAGAEWKADITQRLDAAHCELDWSFEFDRDINLTVVQWSALTRMLRELINNVIVHAHATRASVSAHYQRGRFTLQVSDDGAGRRPETWAHGLGLGGIRKRVKLLGGEVHWRENGARGVSCEIRVPDLGERA